MRRVKMVSSQQVGDAVYSAQGIYNVAEALAASWIRGGMAEDLGSWPPAAAIPVRPATLDDDDENDDGHSAEQQED